MEHYDKDERFMATSDIASLLSSSSSKLDPAMEKRVCAAVLKQLDDSSIDVQSIAVKTLPLLVAKSQQSQEICSLLSEKMIKGEESVRNLYAVGLKTCVANLPTEAGPPVVNKIVPKLITFVGQDVNTGSGLDAIEILNDLLTRFGTDMDLFHESIVKVALAQLANPNNLVRKRAIASLASVAVVAVDASLLNRLVENLLGKIDNTSATKKSVPAFYETTIVQAIGSIGRSAGSRLGPHVNRILPILFRHLKTPSSSTSSSDAQMDVVGESTPAEDELRENILQGLESFILRCPNEMDAHLPTVLQQVNVFIKFDPNFNYDDDDDDVNDEDMKDDEDEDFSDYGGDAGDDDDDTSWKVRRAAAKTLNSIIITRPDALKTYFAETGDLLLSRFKERVESVRLDVLETYKSFLDSFTQASGNGGGGAAAMTTTATTHKAPVPLVRQSSITQALQTRVPEVGKQITKLLKDKSKQAVKTKIASLQVLEKLINVSSSTDDLNLDILLPLTLTCLQDKNSTLRLEALTFCKVLLIKASGNLTEKHLELMKTLILKNIQADWFKIVAEALRCTYQLCLRVQQQQQQQALPEFGGQIADAVLPRLKQTDIDQEIKICAIIAAGVTLAVFGNSLAQDKQIELLNLLMERAKNESTRLFALRALDGVAKSPIKSDAFNTRVAPQLCDELAVLLRQQSRELKQQVLSTLTSIVDCTGFAPKRETLVVIGQEIGLMIVDTHDSHLSHLAFQFIALAVTKLGTDGQIVVREHVAKKIVAIPQNANTFLTVEAHSSLMNVFHVMSSFGGDAGLGFDATFPALFPAASDKLWQHPFGKSSLQILAEACAVVLCGCPQPKKRENACVELLQIASQADDSKTNSRRLVALVTIGEIGRIISLAAIQHPNSADAVLRKTFDDADDGARIPAAVSLGKCAVGDANHFLPILMKDLEKKDSGKNQYLLLLSLREVVSSETSTAHIADWFPTVKTVLEINSSNPDEGVRSVVAECFGKLAVLVPDQIIPSFVFGGGGSVGTASAVEGEEETKWTKISSMRYALVSLSLVKSPTQYEAAATQIKLAFRPAVASFLQDGNLEIAKSALLTCHALIHHAPNLVGEIFPHGEGLVEILFETTAVRPELQTKVDFGAFKLLVDDGLPLRKSAFSCLSAFLENIPSLLGSLSSGPLIPVVIRALNDSPEDIIDIVFLAHQIVTQLCHRAPLAVLAHTQGLMTGLQVTFEKELVAKDASKPIDADKLERRTTTIRSALRLLDQIVSIPAALGDRVVSETVLAVQKNDRLKNMCENEGLKNILKKTTVGGGGSASA